LEQHHSKQISNGWRTAVSFKTLLKMQLIKDHTTLVAAVKAAGLVETLQGKDFYCFAPTNAALLNYQWEQLKHY
jgi:uncharacterized surface protein with fasciclin (FAS1) repeats